MKTKNIYHLDADCNIVKIEKRTTLWGVVVKRESISYKCNKGKNNEPMNPLSDTQNECQSLFCKQGSERVISEAQSLAPRLPNHIFESENSTLRNMLHREIRSIDSLVQILLKRERNRTLPQKRHSESLESCLLHQTANLLHILSARVIPYLERLDNNKNQHS